MELWKWIERLKDAIYEYNLHFSDEETKYLVFHMESEIYHLIFDKNEKL